MGFQDSHDDGTSKILKRIQFAVWAHWHEKGWEVCTVTALTTSWAQSSWLNDQKLPTIIIIS